ncbi:AsnC family transcriptional regulator [Candidatus Pacearchaeota archaeon]|nr:AsnC family transcriptional regulator [Candidatus Pacearchaeota archaeon]
MRIEIDDIDKRIIYELDRNSRISEVALAKKIGKSKEAVRYRIGKLKDKGVILGFTTWIDPVSLGYSTVKMYLQLANIPSKRKELIAHVTSDKRLFWLGIAEGAWNAGLTYFVKSPEEFFELKNSLFSKYKDLILESKIGNVVSVSYHDKTFLFKENAEWTSMFDKHVAIELDKVSKGILRKLFKNARENIATIAHEMGVSVDIVRGRMRKLEEQEIIKRYTTHVDYSKLGYELYKTFLYFRCLSSAELERFMEYVRKDQNIIHVIKQISPWDMELEILCKGFGEYNLIVSKLTEEFSKNINKVESAVIIEEYIFPAEKMVFE